MPPNHRHPMTDFWPDQFVKHPSSPIHFKGIFIIIIINETTSAKMTTFSAIACHSLQSNPPICSHHPQCPYSLSSPVAPSIPFSIIGAFHHSFNRQCRSWTRCVIPLGGWPKGRGGWVNEDVFEWGRLPLYRRITTKGGISMQIRIPRLRFVMT